MSSEEYAYRGVLVRQHPWGYTLLVLLDGYEYALSIVTSASWQRDLLPCHEIDKIVAGWQVRLRHTVSIDQIPWSIHAIEPIEAREAAYAAFLASRSAFR